VAALLKAVWWDLRLASLLTHLFYFSSSVFLKWKRAWMTREMIGAFHITSCSAKPSFGFSGDRSF